MWQYTRIHQQFSFPELPFVIRNYEPVTMPKLVGHPPSLHFSLTARKKRKEWNKDMRYLNFNDQLDIKAWQLDMLSWPGIILRFYLEVEVFIPGLTITMFFVQGPCKGVVRLAKFLQPSVKLATLQRREPHSQFIIVHLLGFFSRLKSVESSRKTPENNDFSELVTNYWEIGLQNSRKVSVKWNSSFLQRNYTLSQAGRSKTLWSVEYCRSRVRSSHIESLWTPFFGSLAPSRRTGTTIWTPVGTATLRVLNIVLRRTFFTYRHSADLKSKKFSFSSLLLISNKANRYNISLTASSFKGILSKAAFRGPPAFDWLTMGKKNLHDISYVIGYRWESPYTSYEILSAHWWINKYNTRRKILNRFKVIA